MERIVDGTIVAFASTRRGLDFFHTGILSWKQGHSNKKKEDLLLFHAARSAGKVIVEPLIDFLRRNRMRGIAFAAPLDKER